MNLAEKGARLRQLHDDPELLVLVNVWDVISAKVVADLPGRRGARHGEPLDRRVVRLPRRRAHPARPDDRGRRPHRRRRRPARHGRPRGRLRRRRRDDPPRHRRRHRRRQPRGPDEALSDDAFAPSRRPSRPASGRASRSCSTPAPTRSCAPATGTREAVLADAIERGRAYLEAGATCVRAGQARRADRSTRLVEGLGDRKVSIIGGARIARPGGAAAPRRRARLVRPVVAARRAHRLGGYRDRVAGRRLAASRRATAGLTSFAR